MAGSKKPHLSWEVHEYVHREKSADWYWAVGIITFSIAITSILFDNLLFAIFIILSFLTLVMYSKRMPSLLKITLDERGIQDGNIRYPYSTIESFCIEDQETEHKIIIKSKKRMMPYVVIPIKGVDADTVHCHLKKFLKEAEHTEPLARRLLGLIGF